MSAPMLALAQCAQTQARSSSAKPSPADQARLSRLQGCAVNRRDFLRSPTATGRSAIPLEERVYSGSVQIITAL